MHEMQISHRDIKLENVLVGEDGRFKLCDFGSASLTQYNAEMSAGSREQLISELEKVTTPMYRAPELVDKF
jgi:serine/threonine protein kinase